MKTNKSPSKLIPGKATASQATPNKASAPSDPSCGVDFFDELQGLGGNGLSIQSFDSLTNQTSDNAETDPRHSDLGRWTDEQLVDAYLKHRRPEHFEVLIRRYERELFTFLRRFLGSVQHAEDVFQGTFLSVHLRIEQFEPGKRFRPWLYAIASNKAIDFMRRNKRHQMTSLDAAAKHNDSEESLSCRLASPASSPDEMAMRSENSSKVREAVEIGRAHV